MRNIWILFKREMMSYFYSPIAYVVGVCVLALTGMAFGQVVLTLLQSPADYSPMGGFFFGPFTWFILLIVPPILTMRVFADEEKSGAIESMMTAPIRDVEYVLAKFFGAYTFFVLLWLPTVNYVFLLRYFARDSMPLDPGPLIGGYVGLALIGLMLISIGCMASACTRNQVIAAVISFAIGLTIFIVGIFFYILPSDKYHAVLGHVSMFAHLFHSMSRGVLEWPQLVFYVSMTAFFLFVTHRMVQSRRWKT